MTSPDLQTPEPGIEQEPAAKNPLSDLLLFGFGALIALGVTIWFSRVLVQSFQARSWQSAPCKIVSFEAEAKSKGKYYLRAAYEYQFGGAQFAGKDYRLSGDFTRDRSVLDKYQAGTETVCYVNPASPTQAVLDRSIGARDILYPAGGFVFFAVLVFLTKHSFRQLKARGSE